MGTVVCHMRLARPLILSLALCAAVPAASAQAIVGGKDATPGRYPAVANVVIAGAFGCTGTLIAPTWVLTAGHCSSITGGTGVGSPAGFLPQMIKVTLGTDRADGQGGEQPPVKRVVVEPNYLASQGSDISLLELGTASKQPPVHVAGKGAEALWAPGVLETIAGFGLTKENGDPPAMLQEARVPRVADAGCAAAYPDSFESRTQLCAGYPEGGTDTCQGDSGGPLFGQDAMGVLRVVGVTSYGDGCAKAGKPGVYARVADEALREFVRTTVPGAVQDDTAAPGGSAGGGSTGGGSTGGGTGGGGTKGGGTSKGGSSPAPCASRRVITLRLPRGLRKAKASTSAGKIKILKGSRLRVRADLRGLHPQTVRVHVAGRRASGKAFAVTHRYRLCVKR